MELESGGFFDYGRNPGENVFLKSPKCQKPVMDLTEAIPEEYMPRFRVPASWARCGASIFWQRPEQLFRRLLVSK
jgi:hypothetical protein